MPTLSESLRGVPGLQPSDGEWLHLLVGDWQLVADLSFADLVLWVRQEDGSWRSVAHVRPTTGPMVFVDDQVGESAGADRQALLEQAWVGRRIVRATHAGRGDQLLREDAVPVAAKGRVIAVLTRHTNLASLRAPSRMELTFVACGDALVRMVVRGDYPFASAPTGLRRGAPRIGDGMLRMDVEGVILYATPNAVSVIHRMGYVGEVVGASFAQIVTGVIEERSPIDESLPLVLTGRQPWRTEVVARGAEVSLRAVPLSEEGERVGAVLLVRDVSELRRREQQLLTREATIREIHHRVKNNLQSVAALLRMQARRIETPQARQALEEAVRRVNTIAVVHDTLSRSTDETVDVDTVIDLSVSAVVEVSAAGVPVSAQRVGSIGRIRAEDATSLAMIVSELVQNAVEHGLGQRGGTVRVELARGADDRGGTMTVTVVDDGIGLSASKVPGSSGLGMQIVQSLAQDLHGSISWSSPPQGGTSAVCRARLRPLPGGSA